VPACEIVDFDLLLERESYNIFLGLYNQYLVRYQEKDDPFQAYTIKDTIFLDFPIMAL